MEVSNRIRRLLKDVDLPVRRGIVARYGAGLAGIALLSVVGTTGRDDSQLSRYAKLSTAHADRATPEHRRQVFQERRDRFTQGVDKHAIPVHTVRPTNHALVIFIQ